MLALVGACGFALAGTAYAQAVPASADDVAFFVGDWATGPAPVDGYETIPAAPPDCTLPVRIEADEDGGIVRTVRRRDGAAHSAAFRVMRFAGNYPWRSDDGGPAPVARKIDEQSFDLAPTMTGRADWSRAIRHQRCVPAPQ